MPVLVIRKFRELTPGVTRILTWGGLRGGISVALALSLPGSPERETILTIIYCVVVFSILVQGLTIGKLIKSDNWVNIGDRFKLVIPANIHMNVGVRGNNKKKRNLAYSGTNTT